VDPAIIAMDDFRVSALDRDCILTTVVETEVRIENNLVFGKTDVDILVV